MTFILTAHNLAQHYCRERSRALRILGVLSFLILVAAPVFGAPSIGEEAISSPPRIQAFQPGETLTYDISWSNVFSAGTAVMEVKSDIAPEGRDVLKFLVTGRSVGLVDTLFKVHDVVESVFDPQIMQSLTFNSEENYGKKRKRIALVFDHAQRTVVSRVNEDQPKTMSIPEPVQDLLSSFYYLRAVEDVGRDKTIVFDVYEDGKIWTVEVYTLGRELVKTPAGEFSTINLKTHPKHNGVFQNKGVVFIWLTDDSRKIPVLMKVTLPVGSFVFTLKEMHQDGDAK